LYTDIVHGDIKPENILIFEDNGRYIAKLADFGCSIIGNEGNKAVEFEACSESWVAPEWVRKGLSMADAIKTDIYSFALLCVWTLFLSHGDESTTFPKEWTQQELVLNHINDAIQNDNGREERLNNLKLFINATLVDDPKKRASSLAEIINYLTPLTYIFKAKQSISVLLSPDDLTDSRRRRSLMFRRIRRICMLILR